MFYRLLCLSFLVFSSILYANSNLPSFKQDNINILIPELWSINKPIKSGSIVMTRQNIEATINIKQHYFLEPITANALHELRATTHYDGWMKVLSRPASKKETLMANVNDSFLAVYIRQELNNELKLNEFFTAEYYFIKDTNYYILNIETTKQSWKKIQSEWKFFLNNFWIGDGKRPSFHPLNTSYKNWIQDGNFNNMNYIHASPPVQRPLNLTWELVITANETNQDIPLVTSGNDLFMIINNNLTKIDSNSGKQQWRFKLDKAIDRYYLSTINSLLFLKDTHSDRIIALSTDSGEIIYTISVNTLLSDPVFTQNSLYLNDNGIIRKYAIESGFLIWSHANYTFKPGTLFVSEYFFIAQINTNEFVALDPETGSLAWKTKPCQLLFSPTCTKDLLLAPIKEGNLNTKIIAFNLKDGSIKWSFNKSILNFSFNHEISATNEFSILSFSIFNNNDEKQHFLIRLNNETGTVDWEYPSKFGFSRPVLGSFFIFSFNKLSNTFTIIDSFTGKDIPPILAPLPLTQFMIFDQSLINVSFSNDQLTIQSLN
tara:strand:- start:509 stop:2143 length:1635 start_codon:yes stop_codon:yes gene_type:complete